MAAWRAATADRKKSLGKYVPLYFRLYNCGYIAYYRDVHKNPLTRIFTVLLYVHFSVIILQNMYTALFEE